MDTLTIHEEILPQQEHPSQLHTCPMLYDVIECYIYNLQLSLPYSTVDATDELTIFQDEDDCTSISTISERIHHLMTRSTSSKASLILSLHYLSKLQESIIIPRDKIYKVIVGCILLSSKFHDDNLFRDNAFFSNISGIELESLNRIEIFILKALRFQLYTSFETFQEMAATILTCALKVALIVSPCLPRRLKAFGFIDSNSDANEHNNGYSEIPRSSYENFGTNCTLSSKIMGTSPVSTFFDGFEEKNLQSARKEIPVSNAENVYYCDEQFIL